MKAVSLKALSVAVTLGLGVPSLGLAEETKKIDPSTVVASVDGKKITLGDLEKQKQMIPQLAAADLPAIFKILREQAVMLEAVGAASAKSGIEKEDKVKEQIAETTKGLIRRAFLEAEAAKLLTDDVLKARFEEVMKEFKPQEEVEISLVNAQDEATIKSILEDLKKNPKDFDKVTAAAAEKGKGTVIARKLGYVTKEELPPALAGAAFALKKDQFTQKPVKAEGGFFILKVHGDKRMSTPPVFEEAKDQIKQMMIGEKVNEIIQKLRAAAKVEVFGMDGKPEPVEAPKAEEPKAEAPKAEEPKKEEAKK